MIDEPTKSVHPRAMNHENLTTGDELFGDPIAPELNDFDLYDPINVKWVELLASTNQLVDGGPEVDLERLKMLREKRHEDEVAMEELAELVKFKRWFRYLHALNVQDDPRELDPSFRPQRI